MSDAVHLVGSAWMKSSELIRIPDLDGPLEAVNNKIRPLHRPAYGYRDPEFFQLELYALHDARYALVG